MTTNTTTTQAATTDIFTADDRIADDMAMTDGDRAGLVKMITALGGEELVSSVAVLVLRIDRLEQRVRTMQINYDEMESTVNRLSVAEGA